MTYKVLNSGLAVPLSFAEAASQPVFNEVATTEDGRDITLGYVDSLKLLPTSDSIVKQRGFDISVYDEVRRDEQVQTALGQRCLALPSKEWFVKAGGNRKVDKMAADFLTEQLNNIPFDRITEKMMKGVFWGYSVAECLWATDGNYIALENIKVKKRRRFGYAPDGSLRLLTTKDQLGEVLPDRKFWAFSLGGDDDDDLYGRGLAHYLYWPTFFKRNGIKFWLIFLEKFGMPTAIGKYPVSASAEEKKALKNALYAVQKDSGITMPEGMMIEFLEAARSGTADYTELHDRMNAAISKVILGHTGTTDATAGRLGSEDIAKAIREDLIAADSDLICSSMNCSVIRWLIGWNFPTAALPKVWRDVKLPEDLKTRAERDKILGDLGFKPTLKYVTETYDGEFVETTTTAPTETIPPETTTAPTFAEKTPIDITNRLARLKARRQGLPIPPLSNGDLPPAAAYTQQVAERTGLVIDQWTAQIKDLLNNSSTLVDFRDALLNQYANLESSELVKVMALAFATAELSGRFDVQQETVA